MDSVLARAVGADPTRPLLTWYDDATGERVELSGATLDNWVAKTANLLVDGCGLSPGDRATVLLPPHWQTAAVLLGCWCAGLSIAVADGPSVAAGDLTVAAGDLGGGASPAPGSPPQRVPTDALFATVDQAVGTTTSESFVLGLAPMGLPLREVPAGFADYITEVRGQGDRFTPYQKIDRADLARHGPAAMTHGELCAAAHGRAAELGIAAGSRVLLDATAHPDPLDWLLGPLAAGATVVLCGHLDPAAVAGRVAAEKATVILTAG